MNSRFFVIWGAPGTGLSLLAAAMRVFGAVPFEEQRGDRFYPLGRFEDQGLVKLNDELLKELGQSWHSLAGVGPEQAELLEKNGFLARAVAFLESCAKRAPIVLLKDPKMTKLAAFWRKAFDAAGIKPYCALGWREPAAVAATLQVRAMQSKHPAPVTDQRLGLLLWLVYNQQALQYTAGFTRALLKFEDFLAKPEETLRSLAQMLDFPLSETDLQTFCAEVLEKGQYADPSGNLELSPKVLEMQKLLAGSQKLQCPVLSGPIWPATVEEEMLASMLDSANHEIRVDAGKMASIHADICILTGECKRMAAELLQLKNERATIGELAKRL